MKFKFSAADTVEFNESVELVDKVSDVPEEG